MTDRDVDDALDLSNLGGKVPPAWRVLLDSYKGSGQPMAVRAEIDVLMLLSELRVRTRLQEEAEEAAERRATEAEEAAERRATEANAVAKQLSASTKVLAVATVILAIATIALIFVTALA